MTYKFTYRMMKVAMVEGTPWRISRDEMFITAPWGEGKLGPLGKTWLSDPTPRREDYAYEVVEISGEIWEQHYTAYATLAGLIPDGPRSAGRLEANMNAIRARVSPEVWEIIQAAWERGYRPLSWHAEIRGREAAAAKKAEAA